MLSVIQKAKEHLNVRAILAEGRETSYEELIIRSAALARILLDGKSDLQEERVSFMVAPSEDYVITLWAIWQAGGIAVPLCTDHPVPSLKYTITDSASSILVISPSFEEMMQPLAEELGMRFMIISNQSGDRAGTLPEVSANRRAMILYTSGTTNLPKGVVTTHANITSQIEALVKAWKWSSDDHILCVLPLHHVHGIINVVGCSLWSGACCEFSHFQPDRVFQIFLQGKVNVFMAVPTIYFKLTSHWETLPQERRSTVSECLKKFRLMVSGSAALPVSLLEKWKKISHHTLLERYGMTELGMAISNPYKGERRPGHVGQPLPGVHIRLCNEKDEPASDGPGEIQVKGPNVFLEYWKKPDATRLAFTADGWFRTGDTAVLDNGYYRILGRTSVDIIKSGGYKISALEVEEILRTHPAIADCSVVGLEDDEWGEIVGAAIIPKGTLTESQLVSWMKQQMPAYRIPRRLVWVNDLPRNAMGKVTKNEVKKMFA
ncbi:MAG: acyl-CoA synthetase [Bacteroidetes bacterium]|nr:acyl-CoA synthetase [Bacteroidota bacterium]